MFDRGQSVTASGDEFEGRDFDIVIEDEPKVSPSSKDGGPGCGCEGEVVASQDRGEVGDIEGFEDEVLSYFFDYFFFWVFSCGYAGCFWLEVFRVYAFREDNVGIIDGDFCDGDIFCDFSFLFEPIADIELTCDLSLRLLSIFERDEVDDEGIIRGEAIDGEG